MLIDRSYKVSVFGDFSAITPTSENMMYFIEKFNDLGLVPTVFQEVQLTPAGGPTPPINRIALMNSDSSLQVPISSGRMDVECTISEDRRLSPVELDNLNGKVFRIFNETLSRFSLKASRLALNTSNLIADISAEDIKEFLSRFTNPISIYGPNALGEWSTRLMTRRGVSLDGADETLNVITIIELKKLNKTVDNETVQIDGFVLNTDINTIVDGRGSHYNVSCLPAFLHAADELWNGILTEVG